MGLMRVRGLLGVLGVVFGVLVFGAGPASAELQYPFVRQIPVSATSLESVAVDGLTGGTLISVGGGAVRVYSASGSLETTWDGSVTPAGLFGRVPDVAVDDATGDAYVVANEEHVVDVLDSTGAYVSQLTGVGVPGGLLEPFAAAVDQASGNVYVYDRGNQVIDVFSSTGLLLSQITSAGGHAFEDVRSMAFDGATGRLLVADSERRVVYELEVSGALVGTWEGLNTPQGSFGIGYLWVAANDATGDVYVAQNGANVVDQFTSAGVYVGQIVGTPQAGFGLLAGVAVAQSNGDVYVADQGPDVVDVFAGSSVVVPDVTTGAASGVLPTGATLNGAVNPDGIQLSDCHFEYGTDTSYGQSAPCVPAAGAIPADSSEHAVSATLAGLVAGTTYHFRLAAANANGANTGADATFATPPPPSVEGAAALNVTSNSVDLDARVNPNGYDTTYRFEWGVSTGYGHSVPVPDGGAGAGISGVPVTTHLSGLSTDTTYHWRVVAQSANGTTTSSDHTFVYSQSGSGLPDNRAYEMVTPPRKNAALIGNGGPFTIPPDVAEGGSRVTGSSIQCFAGSVGCNADRGTFGDPYLFSRTAGGWVTTPLAPSAAGLFADQPSNAPFLVSADVGTALFSVGTPPADEEDWWARGSGGSFVDLGPVSPPVRGAQEAARVGGVATVDLSHVAWTAGSGFLWPFDSSVGESVYEYVGGGNSAPVLVGVSGGLGSTDLISVCGTFHGSLRSVNRLGAMSADGRTVFFTAEKCASGSGVNAGVPVPANEVFARIDESRSVLISGRSPVGCTGVCQGSEAREAEFVGASVDGSRVFFTSAQQLTNDASEDESSIHACSSVGGSGCNLYEYDFAAPGGRSLVAASAGDSSGGGPRVQAVLGISADGSHAYFVAKGVLSTAANSRGVVASDGGENLYVFERDAAYPDGHVAFIGTLSSAEPAQWTEAPTGGRVSVSPDGRFLVFTSRALLTADDTSLSGASQVFRYDAVSGVLTRISIGDRGFNDNGNTQERSPCESGFCSEDASIAQPDFRVPGPVRLDPTMSHDGSFVFFESPVALAPGALDDVRVGTGFDESTPTYAQNVYEYHDGRVYLISDGKDTGNVAAEGAGNGSDVKLIGSDATGANVFFATSDRLVPQDTDTELDYYDARVCTAGDPCITAPSVPAGCLGEGCHGTPPPAPQAAGVGSVSFAGPGNLPAPAPVAAKKTVVKKRHVKHKPRKHHKRKRAKGRKAGHGVHGKKGGRS
jgi:hypothetical protein